MEVMISRATILDHTRILSLLIEWFDEALVDGIPKTCGFTGVWLADLIAKHLVLIATLEDKLIGCIGLRMGYIPWNNEEQLLFNDFLMTSKDARNTGVANKLIEATKDFAKKANVTLFMGHFSGKNPEAKDKYFQLKGFKYAGGNLIYKGE